MTVTHLGRVRGSRRFRISDGKMLRRDVIETHLLTSDDGTDDEENVFGALEAAGFTMGAEWTGEEGGTNPGTRIIRYEIVDHDLTTRRWEVEVEYSSELPEQSESSTQNGSNPINWNPVIEWSTAWEEEQFVKDVAGNPVIFLGTAERPQHPPITKRKALASLRFEKWASSFTAAEIKQYADKKNADEFLGFPAGSALCTGVSANAQFFLGFQYWRVSYEILFRTDDTSPDNQWLGRTTNLSSSYKDTDPVFGGTRKAKAEEQGSWAVPIDVDTGELALLVEEKLIDIYHSVAFAPILL